MSNPDRAVSVASEEPDPSTTRPFGFNVIGHLNGSLGLGIAARSAARLIKKQGFPIATLDIPLDAERSISALERAEFDADAVPDAASLPYCINVFVIGFDHLRRMWDAPVNGYARDDVMNVALSFWELPAFPPQWLPALERLDVMVAASEFMRYAFQFSLSGPSTVSARLPVELPIGVRADRARFDLPADSTIFVTSFDPYSDTERKNSAAAIAAFERGSVGRDQVLLVIKINNAMDNGGVEHEAARALKAGVGDNPRIRVMTEKMDHAEVMSLYASADIYLSLHRAEGLGLGLAEAMLIGKPVIASDWSGNLTFMTHTNSCLVRTRLVPVEGATPIYHDGKLEDTTTWAEPDVDHAAFWVRRLIDDVPLRQRVGAAAAERMAIYNQDASRGEFLDELAAIWDARVAFPARDDSRRNAARASTDRTAPRRHGRLAQIQQLERELNWIKSRPLYRMAAVAKAFVTRRSHHSRGNS